MDNLATSSKFVSAIASGENWRDIGKKILEQLEGIKTDGFVPNIGFLYITETLIEDSMSLLTLLKSVTGVKNWSGTSAIGIGGCGVHYVDVPAASVLIGYVDEDNFRPFQTDGVNDRELKRNLDPWLAKHDPMLVITHANPFAPNNIFKGMEGIDNVIGGFMVGGMTSFRHKGAVFGHEDEPANLSGFIFTQDVQVATSLSQGCIPMGPLHEVTKIDENIIGHLDGKKAFDVFGEDLKSIVYKKLGYDPEKQLMEEGLISPDFQHILEGEAHIAFPVVGSDKNDFMVRTILGIDPDTGVMAVNDIVHDGQNIMFVHRDDESVRSDLSSTLVALRHRILTQNGVFKPKALVYVSCVARLNVDFDGKGNIGAEMELIKEIMGDIPTAGFYARGEISSGRVYGHTGIVILFL